METRNSIFHLINSNYYALGSCGGQTQERCQIVSCVARGMGGDLLGGEGRVGEGNGGDAPFQAAGVGGTVDACARKLGQNVEDGAAVATFPFS